MAELTAVGSRHPQGTNRSASPTGAPSRCRGSDAGEPSEPPREVDRQIRGSSLLLFGRILSMVANLVVQVLVVRALTRSDYGIFAYALSVVTTLTTVVTFGLDRGFARFIVVYEEKGDLAKLWGVITCQLATILGLGAAAAAVAIGAQGFVAGTLVEDDRLARLLAVMVVLAPVQALDGAAASLFAAFGESKAIFLRRYVLGPVLRLAVVAVVLLLGGDVFALGAGYLVAGLIGLAVYGTLLGRSLRARGLLQPRGAPRRRLDLPLREVGAFTLPLLASDAMFVALSTTDVVILGRTHGSEAVAALRAVLPLSHLNQLVMNSFALLFGPLMARLWTRGDQDQVGDAYWRTAAWVAVLTFPIVAVTLGLAEPVVGVLFGSRYAESATYLQVLAGAAYFNASLGFNGVTVKMVGRVGLVAASAALGLVVNLALTLLLIPPHGAIGAAWATGGTIVAYNVVKHAALRRAVGIELISHRYRPVYVTVALAFGALVLGAVADLSAVPSIVVALVTTAAVLLIGRRHLAADDMFPELARLPLVGRLLGPGSRA